jgi:hypothetical protein
MGSGGSSADAETGSRAPGVGGPTQTHRVSAPLEAQLVGSRSHSLEGFAAATFDTRSHGPRFLSGLARAESRSSCWSLRASWLRERRARWRRASSHRRAVANEPRVPPGMPVYVAVIGSEHGRSLRKTCLVIGQAGRQLRSIGWITDQHPVACDESALHFIEDDLATELSRNVRFATPHDGRVRLEQTHQLASRWDAFAVKHATFGLGDDLLDERRGALQCRLQPTCGRIRPARQPLLHLLSLPDAGLRDLQ